MSRTWQWFIGLAIILIVAATLFSALWPLFTPRSNWSSYGMMGPGHMYGGGTMMGGFGMPFLGLMMGGVFLGPVLVIGLIVLGVVWLARRGGTGTPTTLQPPAPTGISCAHCGQTLQPGWKACPHCGEKVA